MQAARKEDVLNALTRVARDFRTRVGESLTTVEKYEHAASRGDHVLDGRAEGDGHRLRLILSSDPVAAIPHLRHAIELDSGFAMAHATLGLYTAT